MKRELYVSELKDKLEDLKKLLKQPGASASEIHNAINHEIEYVQSELIAAKCKLTRSELIGRYYKVTKKDDISYLHVKDLDGETIIADEISYYTWTGSRNLSIVENSDKIYGDKELGFFSEITKEDFIKAYKELVDNHLKIFTNEI